ncbi:MAG: hypothetical protein ACTSVI_01670 [Promethearchaeota archaeon]
MLAWCTSSFQLKLEKYPCITGDLEKLASLKQPGLLFLNQFFSLRLIECIYHRFLEAWEY